MFFPKGIALLLVFIFLFVASVVSLNHPWWLFFVGVFTLFCTVSSF